MSMNSSDQKIKIEKRGRKTIRKILYDIILFEKM